MSSWAFQIFIDIAALDSLLARTNNLQPLLERVGDTVKKEVVSNIVRKSIIDTGALRDSITHHVTGPRTVEVSDGVSYGVYNEFGTYKMPARPFFVPAAMKAGEVFTRGFIELLR